MVPLVVVREQVDERVIADDMAQGARDTVSLQQPERLQAVIARELRAFRLERALNSTLRASQDYRSQLEVVLQRSNDAIAQVQEGILVDANAAWLELFGFAKPAGLVGQPVMDLFEESTHAALKAALTACLQGRWSNHPLKADAMLARRLGGAARAGAGARRIRGRAERAADRAGAEARRAHSSPGTRGGGAQRSGHRPAHAPPLLTALQERLRTPVAGGVRYLACVRPDKFADIERDLGVLVQRAVRHRLHPVVRALLGPQRHRRPLRRHHAAAAAGARQRPRRRGLVRNADRPRVQAPVSDPIRRRRPACHLQRRHGIVPQQNPDLNACVMDALDALRRGRARGSGGQLVTVDRADNDTRVKAYDQIWVKHIKAALMENRFRLVQQPIAALAGGSQKMFDVAIRMLDTQGKEVLPSEFLPAASRNDLLKNIDRWVIGASLSFVSKRKPDLLFVRLSRDSALDPSLLQWLELQLRATVAEAQRLCLQITEEVASNHAAADQALGERRARRAACASRSSTSAPAATRSA